MTSIQPFGSSLSVGDPNISKQKHFGATLKDFSIQADWSSQAGKLSMTLVEDDVDGDKFTVPVINSPYFFTFNGFTYGGIVDSVHRKIDPSSGKMYSVELSSPNKILKNVQIVTDGYLGYGYSVEGVPSGISSDNYYVVDTSIDSYAPSGAKTTSSDSYLLYGNLSFGSNNNDASIDWTTNYNIMNVYGAYENDQYYQFSTLKGYGAAGNSDAGIRFDRLIVSLHQLVNHTTPSDGQRYLGGTILYGTDEYNITSSVNPYYYGFDAIGFYNQVSGALPPDFRVSSNNGVISILDMVEAVCNEINYEFMVVLNSGQTMSDEGGSDSNVINQTYPNTIPGGWIGIETFSKNAVIDPNQPYSKLSTSLLNLEIPNVGDFGINNVNPGTEPTGSYRDPMQDDYLYVGTEASRPYGGKFPVATSSDYASVVDSLDTKIKNGSMSIQATDGIAYKFVVGGKQTRIVYAPRDYIYNYWGTVEFVDTPLAGTGILEAATRSIPVVTPVLHANDINDFVLIDTQQIFSNDDVCQTVRKGIYTASVLEIRAAMSSYDSWFEFISTFKPKKLAAIYAYAFKKKFPSAFQTPIMESLPQVQGLVCKPEGSKYSAFIQLDNVTDATKDPAYLTWKSSWISTGLVKGHTGRISIKKRQAQYQKTVDTTASKLEAEAYYDKIMTDLHATIKNIGDSHYGKSWCVVLPYVSTRITDSSESIVGNIEKSWDITDSAYLEPYAFNSLKAPKSNLFVSDGKIKPYINYEHSFESSGPVTGIFSSFHIPSGGTYVYDFSEYDPTTMVHTSGISHGVPESMDSQYSYVPADYFVNYDRSKIPFSRISDNSVWTAVLVENTGIAGINNVSAKMPKNSASTTTITESGSWQSEDLGVRMDVLSSVIDDFTSIGLGSNDYGSNMIHMVRFKTKRVFMPTSDVQNLDFEYGDFNQVMARGLNTTGFGGYQVEDSGISTSIFNKVKEMEIFPSVITPLGVGIPQISNRHRYGPWVTTFNKNFAGNVEFVTDDSLVPENHLIPLYGTLPTGVTFSLDENFSGTAGMNLAGQAIANSIDNFSLFADEQATITIAGTPLITRIGEALILDGNQITPYITDMSVTINDNSIDTTYNFRTYSPRQNKTNRDIINRIQKLSNGIKNIYKGR